MSPKILQIALEATDLCATSVAFIGADRLHTLHLGNSAQNVGFPYQTSTILREAAPTVVNLRVLYGAFSGGDTLVRNGMAPPDFPLLHTLDAENLCDMVGDFVTDILAGSKQLKSLYLHLCKFGTVGSVWPLGGCDCELGLRRVPDLGKVLQYCWHSLEHLSVSSLGKRGEPGVGLKHLPKLKKLRLALFKTDHFELLPACLEVLQIDGVEGPTADYAVRFVGESKRLKNLDKLSVKKPLLMREATKILCKKTGITFWEGD